MAVMNRFAAVAESLNQTQPWVISKYCFLSERILFEQISLLDTSFFLLPLANRAVSRSVPPQHSLLLSFPPFCLAEAWNSPSPLAPWSQRVFSVLCHKITLCPATTLLWPGCGVSSSPISSQMGNDCSVSVTEEHRHLLSMITFLLRGDQWTSSQTGGRRTNHLMYLTAALAVWLSPVFHHDIGVC